ncbi:hypothetical protein D9M69_565900 [compost metagenome]
MDSFRKGSQVLLFGLGDAELKRLTVLVLAPFKIFECECFLQRAAGEREGFSTPSDIGPALIGNAHQSVIVVHPRLDLLLSRRLPQGGDRVAFR